MRSLILALAIAAPVIATRPSPAHATCDDFCNGRLTLVGWSADGHSWVAIEDHDGTIHLEQNTGNDERAAKSLVVYTDGKVVARFANLPAQAAETIGPFTKISLRNTSKRSAVERVDVTSFAPLRGYKFLNTNASWRQPFAKAVSIKPGGERNMRPTANSRREPCKTWIVSRAQTEVRRLVRYCEDALVASKTIGGYVHPMTGAVLIKLRYNGARLMSWEGYELIGPAK